MKNSSSIHWISMGLMAIGLLAFPAMSRADDEREVRYDDLPHHVRDSFDRERHDHKISAIWEVSRGDRTFYRAIVEERNGEHVMRVDRDGHLLTEEVAPPEREWETKWHATREGLVVHYEDLPHRVREALDQERHDHKISELYRIETPHHSFYRAVIEQRDGEHVVRVDDDGRILTAEVVPDWERAWETRWSGSRLGETVDPNEVPRTVRHAVDRELGRTQIREVRKFDMGGLPVYQVAIDGHPDRLIEVLANGIVLGEGQDVRREMRSVPMGELPREVRDALRHEAGRAEIENVFVAHRHGDHIYIGVAAGHEGVQTYITVDERGRIISEDVK